MINMVMTLHLMTFRGLSNFAAKIWSEAVQLQQ